MQRQGIVMELQSDFAVVLSSDGEFCRLPRTDSMVIGALVRWEGRVSEATGNSSRKGRARSARRLPVWRRVAVAGAAACLAIAAGVWYGQVRPNSTVPSAYAMVSVDINPSVALELTKKLTVADAYGYNQDGRRLLSTLHVKNKPLKSALTDIVNAAVADGMMPDQDTILISTAPAGGNDRDVSAVQKQAQTSVQDAIAHNPKAQNHHPSVYAISVSPSVWHAADSAKVSPGQFASYVIASKSGKDVSIAQLHGPALKDIISSAEASSVLKVLGSNDTKNVETLIQGLHKFQGTLPSALGATGPDNEDSQPTPPGGPGNGKSRGNGNGKGQGNNNGRGNDKGQSAGQGNSGGPNRGAQAPGQNKDSGSTTNPGKSGADGGVTIHIGDSEITIPVGPHGNLGSPTSGIPKNMPTSFPFGNQLRGANGDTQPSPPVVHYDHGHHGYWNGHNNH